MVRADAGGDCQLQLLRLGDALGGQIGRPEGLRDHDFGIGQFALEVAVRAVLVGGHDQGVAIGLQVLAQAELAGDAAEQAPGDEVDGLGRRGGLAAWIPVDLRNLVARIGLRVAGNRVVVQDAKDFRHLISPEARLARLGSLTAVAVAPVRPFVGADCSHARRGATNRFSASANRRRLSARPGWPAGCRSGRSTRLRQPAGIRARA